MTEPSGYVDETHQRIAEFADEFIDDEDERGAFVDALLERRGYQRSQHWAAPEPQPGGGGAPGPLLRPRRAASGGGPAGGRQQRPRTYFK
jgi:hypothetical protein